MNHLTYWKLAQSPFTQGMSKPFFYSRGSVDEAVSRVRYLIENKRELGTLIGSAGIGKSALLRNLRWTCGRIAKGPRPEFVYVPMAGMMHGELPKKLLTSLRVGSPFSIELEERPMELIWRDLEDASVSAAVQNQRLVFLLDDADGSHSLIWDDILRLIQLPGGATCVLSLLESNLASIPFSILERCELRIDLPPWELAQTADYFEWALFKSEASDDLFDSQAIIRIQELSNGVPRRIAQLAELGLVSGAVRRALCVHGPLIDQVASEVPELISRHTASPFSH